MLDFEVMIRNPLIQIDRTKNDFEADMMSTGSYMGQCATLLAYQHLLRRPLVSAN